MYTFCQHYESTGQVMTGSIPDQTIGPIQVFIGGLFHLVGQGNGFGFKRLLNGLRAGNPAVRSYWLEEQIITPWEEKIRQNFRFMDICLPQPEIDQLVKEWLLPDYLIDPLQSVLRRSDGLRVRRQVEAVSQHLSRINLIGYSYGSSLIQELNWSAYQRLVSTGLSPVQAEEVLSCLVAISSGPVGRFRDAAFGFTQLTVVHREDLMSHELCDLRYPEPDFVNVCVTAGRTHNHLLLIPEIGTPTVRALLQKQGDPARKMVYEYHEEKHNLFMYLNRSATYVDTSAKLMTFASLPTGELIMKFNELAVESAHRSALYNRPRIGRQLLDQFQRRSLQSCTLTKLEQRFRLNEKKFDQETEGKLPELKKSLWSQPHFLKDVLVRKELMYRPILK